MSKESKIIGNLKSPEHMTFKECTDEIAELREEMLSIDKLIKEKIVDRYPISYRLISIRFNSLHNRICELFAKGHKNEI